MNITKDKEINGLYIRHGKRGDVWNYVRNKQGKLKRASLGPVNTFTVAQARQWALELHEGKEVIADAATFTLAEVVDRAVEEQRQRGNKSLNI